MEIPSLNGGYEYPVPFKSEQKLAKNITNLCLKEFIQLEEQDPIFME